MGSHHVFERVMRARRHVTGRHQPGAVLLKEFGELQDISQSPATFSPVVALADYHPALLDEEAGFLLAIQSDTQRRAVGLCAHMRNVPHGPACTACTKSPWAQGMIEHKRSSPACPLGSCRVPPQ